MKFLICLFLIGITGWLVYSLLSKRIFQHSHEGGKKAIRWTAIIVGLLLMCLFFIIYFSSYAPDRYCLSFHPTKTVPPSTTVTAEDYFSLGNYHYDSGQCPQAIADYTKAIDLNPAFAKAYNNRAYTYMRMQQYPAALVDLNKAISLDPSYVNALMNRGDIYNYYYAINRQKAISDYNKVIVLGKQKDKSNSVCGHKAMAETNNSIPLAFLKFIFNRGNCN